MVRKVNLKEKPLCEQISGDSLYQIYLTFEVSGDWEFQPWVQIWWKKYNHPWELLETQDVEMSNTFQDIVDQFRKYIESHRRSLK